MSPTMSFQHANVVGEHEKKHRIFYRHRLLFSFVFGPKTKKLITAPKTGNFSTSDSLDPQIHSNSLKFIQFPHLQVLEDLRAGNIFAGHLFFTAVVFGPPWINKEKDGKIAPLTCHKMKWDKGLGESLEDPSPTWSAFCCWGSSSRYLLIVWKRPWPKTNVWERVYLHVLDINHLIPEINGPTIAQKNNKTKDMMDTMSSFNFHQWEKLPHDSKKARSNCSLRLAFLFAEKNFGNIHRQASNLARRRLANFCLSS